MKRNDILPMKLVNGFITPSTKTESTKCNTGSIKKVNKINQSHVLVVYPHEVELDCVERMCSL